VNLRKDHYHTDPIRSNTVNKLILTSNIPSVSSSCSVVDFA